MKASSHEISFSENSTSGTLSEALKTKYNSSKVKLILTSSTFKEKTNELILNKAWIKEKIPKLRDAINDVTGEIIEISINCNVETFNIIL